MSKVQPQRAEYNRLVTEISELNEKVTAAFSASDEKGGGMSPAEVEQVKDWNKTIEEKSIAAAELKDLLGLRDAADQRAREFKTPANPMQFSGGDSKAMERAVQTLGETFTGDEFKSWLQRIAPQGRIPNRTHIQSPPVEFAGLKAITGLSSTSAGALVTNDRLGIVDMGTFYRPLSMRSVVTNGQTDSDVVEYVRQGTHTNNAASVAEATGSGDGTGAKPESDMALQVVTENVVTIAHFITVTNRALQDAAQIRTLIDNFLRYGLEYELEDQMINGNGGGDFTGILNTTGTGTQAWSTDILTTTRKARTKVQTEGRAEPTAYVLNPLDWETLDLTQDAEDRYYFGGPMVMGTPRLWGLPVVTTEAIAQGVGIVADFRLAVLWDRMQATISASNSHSDYFIRNLVAVLAELRAAFGVIRPAAFIEIDLTA